VETILYFIHDPVASLAIKFFLEEKIMGKEDEVNVTGASGRSYQFDVYPWGQSFNPVGGVYLVLKKNWQQSSYNIIYVGQTGDLDERFNDQHKQYCFDRQGKTHIGVHGESGEQARLNIERDLIDQYQPICND